MAWATPATMVAGQLVTAAQMNEIINDLIYLKVRTDFLHVGGGFTTGVQTILPAGSYSSLWIHYAIWNETNVQSIGTPNNTVRVPGGLDITMADGVPNTIVLKFPANGSVTAERTTGSVTWGYKMLILYR